MPLTRRQFLGGAIVAVPSLSLLDNLLKKYPDAKPATSASTLPDSTKRTFPTTRVRELIIRSLSMGKFELKRPGPEGDVIYSLVLVPGHDVEVIFPPDMQPIGPTEMVLSGKGEAYMVIEDDEGNIYYISADKHD